MKLSFALFVAIVYTPSSDADPADTCITEAQECKFDFTDAGCCPENVCLPLIQGNTTHGLCIPGCVVEGQSCQADPRLDGGCCGGLNCFQGLCLGIRRSLEVDPEQTCKKYGYHRHLKEVDTRVLMEDHNDCLDTPYDMFLVLEGAHFVGLATPVEGTAAALCPSVIFQAGSATTQDGQKSMKKKAMVSGVTEIEIANLAYDLKCVEDTKVHLGTKPLVSIIEAFDNASVNKNGAKVYDAVSNNCVSLLHNMKDPLDIVIDDEKIAFFAEKLMFIADEYMVKKVSESPALGLLVKGGNRMLKGVGIDKEAMVTKLIKLYV